METRKMKLALSAGALALSMALAGCGGSSSGGGAAAPQPTPEMIAATNAINAARAAVAALTAESDDAAVMAAQTLITTASTTVGALPDDEEASYDEQIATIQTNHNNAKQRVAVADAIRVANNAVNALTITSTELDIETAQGLIETAESEIDKLPDTEEAAQDATLAGIQTLHDTKEAGATEARERNKLIAQINAIRQQLGIGEDEENPDLASSIEDLQDSLKDLQGRLDRAEKEERDANTAAMTAKGKAIYGILDTFDHAIQTERRAAIAATPPVVTASHGEATKVTAAALATFANLSEGISSDTAFTGDQTNDPTPLPTNNGFSGTMLTWSNTGKADTMTVYTDIAAPSRKLFSEVHGGGDQELALSTTAHSGVTGAAFDGRTGGAVTHEPNARTTTDSDTDPTVVKLPGKYNGADGSYQCIGADCVSTVNAGGTITFSGGAGWTFTANTGAMVSVADSAYMSFGWWMRDDKVTARILDHVAVFYNAPVATGSYDITSLTGKASYEGGAAGKYAWRDRIEDTAHGGHFTAKATLTADFSTAEALGRISGSISDFRIGDDGTDPNWTVTLSAADLVSGGSAARSATTPNVTWAAGSGKADPAGSWQAQFSDSGASRNDNLPTGVAGAFNTEFGEQGQMVGAFGANITNPNPSK